MWKTNTWMSELFLFIWERRSYQAISSDIYSLISQNYFVRINVECIFLWLIQIKTDCLDNEKKIQSRYKKKLYKMYFFTNSLNKNNNHINIIILK